MATAFEPKVTPGQYVQVAELVASPWSMGGSVGGGVPGADAGGDAAGAVAGDVVTAAVALTGLSVEEALRRELAAQEAERAAFEAWERAYGQYEAARTVHVRALRRER